MAQMRLPPPRGKGSVVTVPGDKSISHRALLLGAIASGTTTIENLNAGDDVERTKQALRALGVSVDEVGGRVSVTGTADFCDPNRPVDCGNSGTTMRLLLGLCANRVNATFDGDESLQRRPMGRVAEPLGEMGARVETGAGGLPPVRVSRSDEPLRGICHDMTSASAQVQSALLIAGLRASGQVTISSPLECRDHTQRMLHAMGGDVRTHGLAVTVRPAALHALDRISVPGDFSAAFFVLAAAALVAHSHVEMRDVGVNPTRTAALDVLRAMGVRVAVRDVVESYGEPRARVEVEGGATLSGIDVAPAVVPSLVDEIPALCALAAFARGRFSVRGAKELRVKESDRIATTAAILRAFSVDVEELPDGIAVWGGTPVAPAAPVPTYGDHRVGMAAAILAAGAGSALTIEDADCIATSFPGFEDAWRAAFTG